MKKLVCLLIALIAVSLMLALLPVATSAEKCKDLMAGQHTVVGEMCVSNDDTNLYVEYTTTGGWTMTETHLYASIKAPKRSAPGTFPYKHEDLDDVTEDSYTIPLSDFGIGCDYYPLYIAAHAAGSDEETAWAEGCGTFEKDNKDKGWAMWFPYEVLCP